MFIAAQPSCLHLVGARRALTGPHHNNKAATGGRPYDSLDFCTLYVAHPERDDLARATVYMVRKNLMVMKR